MVDSRAVRDGRAVRRRRECLGCGERFTTYEAVETRPVLVVKRSGERVAYDRAKVILGVTKACEKRPVSLEQIEIIVDRVEQRPGRLGAPRGAQRDHRPLSSWTSCARWTRWPTCASPRSTAASRAWTSSSPCCSDLRAEEGSRPVTTTAGERQNGTLRRTGISRGPSTGSPTRTSPWSSRAAAEPPERRATAGAAGPARAEDPDDEPWACWTTWASCAAS